MQTPNSEATISCNAVYLSLPQFSKKDSGIYEVILKDDRGKDKSRLKLVDEGQSIDFWGLFCVLYMVTRIMSEAELMTDVMLMFLSTYFVFIAIPTE